MTKQEAFNHVVGLYDAMRPKYSEALLNTIMKRACISDGASLLEIGAGTGQATETFLKTNAHVRAIELGKDLAAYLETKYETYKNLEVYNGSFEAFTASQNTYDLIYSATAFHWIPEDIGYVKVFKALKPGGLVALFWNKPLVSPENQALKAAIQEQYECHVPDLSKKKKGADYSTCFNWLEKTGFINVEKETFKSQRHLSAEAYIKLLDTYSDHQTLEAKVKDALYEGIKKCIESHKNLIVIEDCQELYLGQKPMDTLI